MGQQRAEQQLLLNFRQLGQALSDGAAFFRAQEVIVDIQAAIAVHPLCRCIHQIEAANREGIHTDGSFWPREIS